MKHVTKLYWPNAGRLDGIPSVIISDRDPRFKVDFGENCGDCLGTICVWGLDFI